MTKPHPNLESLSLLPLPESTDMPWGLAPLNENEIRAVRSLVAYVAQDQQVEQNTIQEVIEARFGVGAVTQIKQKDYEEVIHFLIDMCTDIILN